MRIITFRLRKWYPVFVFVGIVFLVSLLTATAVFAASRETDLDVYTVAEENDDLRIVIIDAGHGGEDSGTIGVSGVYEKDLNLAIALELGRQLTDLGYTVVYTRTDDRLLYKSEENIRGIRKISDLKNRCLVAAEYPEALFISIHMNSFGQSKYSGLQVYYGTGDNESERLARAIQDEVRTQLQPNNQRSVKIGKDIYILEHIDTPAVLIECGFLSNPEECQKLCEKEYQKQLCFSIICGMMKYEKEKLN